VNGRLYLVFGQTFQGGYSLTGGSPTFTQVYSDEIRSFRITNRAAGLAVNWSTYQALRDPVNFRRRDGNFKSVILPNGKPAFTYYGGVFTPGNAGIAYAAPILINANGTARVDNAYQQFFSQYTTGNIALYSAKKRTMNTIFLGGISNWSYVNGQLTMGAAGGATDPWVNNVTALVQNARGWYQEFSFTPLPGFFGAYSAMFTNSSLPAYANGLITLDKITRPVVIGYMYGGIYSTVAETSSNPSTEATQTGASNQVFEVMLTPTGS
jgi:hypothetical protein